MRPEVKARCRSHSSLRSCHFCIALALKAVSFPDNLGPGPTWEKGNFLPWSHARQINTWVASRPTPDCPPIQSLYFMASSSPTTGRRSPSAPSAGSEARDPMTHGDMYKYNPNQGSTPATPTTPTAPRSQSSSSTIGRRSPSPPFPGSETRDPMTHDDTYNHNHGTTLATPTTPTTPTFTAAEEPRTPSTVLQTIEEEEEPRDSAPSTEADRRKALDEEYDSALQVHSSTTSINRPSAVPRFRVSLQHIAMKYDVDCEQLDAWAASWFLEEAPALYNLHTLVQSLHHQAYSAADWTSVGW